MSSKLKIIGESTPHGSLREKYFPVGDRKGSVFIVTLGCDKNQVDSEVVLGGFIQAGYELSDDISQADIIIVNTCGFLQSSIQESIDTILDLSDYRTNGACRCLLVTGCLVKRHKDELQESLPEVDFFLSIDEALRFVTAQKLIDMFPSRIVYSQSHNAYVKLSKGCDHSCSYCVVPTLRGPMRSRSIDSVVEEITTLGANGVREVNLIGQDTTAFGTVVNGAGTKTKSQGLVELLARLEESKAIDWIRLMYAYPTGVSEDLLRCIDDLSCVTEYLDLPLQHSSERILQAMKRPVGEHSARSLVEHIRFSYPAISLRTNFIVGFPGETEQDFNDLEAFVREGHFTHLQLYTFSPEPGTPAYSMDEHVEDELREERYERLVSAQQEVSKDRLDSLIGSLLEVLIEGTHPDTDLLLVGRARFQAPNIDGSVIINDISDSALSPPKIGDLVRVEVSEIAGYDLVGRMIK